MRPPLEEVLDRLEERTGKRATKSGDGFLSRCPAHEDRTPSLSVRAADDGRVLLKCHAGYRAAQIVGALGMTMADLFASPAAKIRARIVAAYEYKDETGRVLFTVERLDPKGFRQRRLVRGEKVWKLGDVRRVLYRMPELLAADLELPVYVVEGEKDVQRLVKLGLTATTNPGGAGKWRAEYNEPFAAGIS